MLFAILCHDRPGALELRQATRPTHLAYLQANKASLVEVGPILDGEGRPCGSLLVVDLADRDTAMAFAAGDPYAKAGLFESTTIRAYRRVFRDGEQVA